MLEPMTELEQRLLAQLLDVSTDALLNASLTLHGRVTLEQQDALHVALLAVAQAQTQLELELPTPARDWDAPVNQHLAAALAAATAQRTGQLHVLAEQPAVHPDGGSRAAGCLLQPRGMTQDWPLPAGLEPYAPVECESEDVAE
jgi:hypothetical protein